MKHRESQHIGDTIRIRRPARVFTDPLGRCVWMGDVDPCELDLESDTATDTDPYNCTGTGFDPVRS